MGSLHSQLSHRIVHAVQSRGIPPGTAAHGPCEKHRPKPSHNIAQPKNLISKFNAVSQIVKVIQSLLRCAPQNLAYLPDLQFAGRYQVFKPLFV